MSILEKAAKIAARSAAKYAGQIAATKATEKMKEIGEERHKKLFDAQAGTGNLVIKQKRYTWKDKLDVLDENQQIKYTVKGELTSLKHHRHIYDLNGKELGVIKQKLISLRLPISLESHPVDFIFEIGGQKMGTVKSTWAFGKKKYEVDFNGWRIEGNVLGFQYKIFNGNEVIANISEKFVLNADTYVINILNPVNELVVLMIVITLDAANSGKSNDLKKTINKKSRWF